MRRDTAANMRSFDEWEIIAKTFQPSIPVPALLNQIFRYGSWLAMCDSCSKCHHSSLHWLYAALPFRYKTMSLLLDKFYTSMKLWAPITHSGLDLVLYPSLIRADDRIGTTWYSLSWTWYYRLADLDLIIRSGWTRSPVLKGKLLIRATDVHDCFADTVVHEWKCRWLAMQGRYGTVTSLFEWMVEINAFSADRWFHLHFLK